ncbi:MAG TPA: alkaline phosphatase PhoX, partial [Solirubrobacteraceae bacterium]|nr:alkaline phosphatase PhoX [Solirubrobacteraceae bacterium]
MRRRDFLVGAAGLALGSAFWEKALRTGARAAASSYGALGAADANGLRLPPGFSSRLIARANQRVKGTAYPWHIFPDGQATFPLPDGGWVLVSNSESVAASGAGSSAIRFRKNGAIADAYRILSGTNSNCAGGGTPWGRWLSCEEHDFGHVWECDPTRPGQGTIRPALGTFNHEAAAVDAATGALYMTEDRPDGGFYRFTPDTPGDLRAGLLEIAVDAGGGRLAFTPVPDPGAVFTPTRRQVPDTRRFDGGEGIWYDGGTVHFSTKGDDHVWAYDTATGALGTIYDGGGPLSGVDNLTVNPAGEVFVCEDGGNMEICVIEPDGTVAPFLQLTGEAAVGLPDRGNELAGVIFDPSHGRLYFSAQRAYGFGAVYEVRGPFHGAGASAASPLAPSPPRGRPAGEPGLRMPTRVGAQAL